MTAITKDQPKHVVTGLTQWGHSLIVVSTCLACHRPASEHPKLKDGQLTGRCPNA